MNLPPADRPPRQIDQGASSPPSEVTRIFRFGCTNACSGVIFLFATNFLDVGMVSGPEHQPVTAESIKAAIAAMRPADFSGWRRSMTAVL